ncbi:MAG: sigma-54 dependent transcriptional regulator [Planctomycetota bacterium]
MTTKLLVVDDKQAMRDAVATTLQRAGYTIVAASDGQAALKLIQKHNPAAVVTDLRMPEMTGLELLAQLHTANPTLPVVLMTAYGTVEDAVEAMKHGAFDFIQKPFEPDQLVSVVRRAVEQQRVTQNSVTPPAIPHRAASSKASSPPPQITTSPAPALVGKSPAMKTLAKQIHQIAGSHGTVLIHGESGAGKEVVARTIHAHSPRRDRLMLCLNCAALSSSLLESELFGHEKGAFTGADQLRKGRFELADGGTLLLDEISEISPQLQAKLLRVLQEGQFERVGSSATQQIDVRVIATTNRDLARSVADGSFRQDLFYRLNVLPVVLPPLRDRLADIPLLAEHFLAQVALREDREPKRFHPDALELMSDYPWPGNVRELQNICERASVLTRGQTITAPTLKPWLIAPTPAAAHPTTPPLDVHGYQPWAAQPAAPAPTHAPLGSPPLQAPPAAAPVAPAPSPSNSVRPLEETQRQEILQTLSRFGGNRTRTAEALGIGVRTLGLKLKKWKADNLIPQSV